MEGYKLAWSDEFDSDTLDPDKWVYRTDSKHWSTQLPGNVVLRDGLLRLGLTRLDRPDANGMHYGGAGVISRRAFRHGYYEARFKCPPGAGWHSSFWLMRHDGQGGTGTDTAAQEIDICEQDSINPHGFAANLHRWNPTPHHVYGAIGVKTPDLSADFHIWGCAFTPNRLTFYFNGKECGVFEDIASFEHNDHHIWLTSIASHHGGTREVDDTRLPSEAQFDWVRFYEKEPT